MSSGSNLCFVIGAGASPNSCSLVPGLKPKPLDPVVVLAAQNRWNWFWLIWCGTYTPVSVGRVLYSPWSHGFDWPTPLNGLGILLQSQQGTAVVPSHSGSLLSRGHAFISPSSQLLLFSFMSSGSVWLLFQCALLGLLHVAVEPKKPCRAGALMPPLPLPSCLFYRVYYLFSSQALMERPK